MIIEAIGQKALEYLNGKKGSKGSEISYTNIKLADIADKRYILQCEIWSMCIFVNIGTMK